MINGLIVLIRVKLLRIHFNLLNGSEVKVDFMNKTYGSAGFARGKDFTRASLGLKNCRWNGIYTSWWGGISLWADCIFREMKQTFEGGESFVGEVVWKIPKFSFGSSLKLGNMLVNLGVTSAFKVGCRL